jgi:hypothetical protein
MSVTLGVTTLVTHHVSGTLRQQKERRREYGKPGLVEDRFYGLASKISG